MDIRLSHMNGTDALIAIRDEYPQARVRHSSVQKTGIEELLVRSFLNWPTIEQEIGSRYFIRSHFPKLYEHLVDRCKELSQARGVEAQLRLNEDVKCAVGKLTSQGILPTLRQVIKVLPSGPLRGLTAVYKTLRSLLASQQDSSAVKLAS